MSSYPTPLNQRKDDKSGRRLEELASQNSGPKTFSEVPQKVPSKCLPIFTPSEKYNLQNQPPLLPNSARGPLNLLGNRYGSTHAQAVSVGINRASHITKFPNDIQTSTNSLPPITNLETTKTIGFETSLQRGHSNHHSSNQQTADHTAPYKTKKALAEKKPYHATSNYEEQPVLPSTRETAQNKSLFQNRTAVPNNTDTKSSTFNYRTDKKFIPSRRIIYIPRLNKSIKQFDYHKGSRNTGNRSPFVPSRSQGPPYPLRNKQAISSTPPLNVPEARADGYQRNTQNSKQANCYNSRAPFPTIQTPDFQNKRTPSRITLNISKPFGTSSQRKLKKFPTFHQIAANALQSQHDQQEDRPYCNRPSEKPAQPQKPFKNGSYNFNIPRSANVRYPAHKMTYGGNTKGFPQTTRPPNNRSQAPPIKILTRSQGNLDDNRFYNVDTRERWVSRPPSASFQRWSSTPPRLSKVTTKFSQLSMNGIAEQPNDCEISKELPPLTTWPALSSAKTGKIESSVTSWPPLSDSQDQPVKILTYSQAIMKSPFSSNSQEQQKTSKIAQDTIQTQKIKNPTYSQVAKSTPWPVNPKPQQQAIKHKPTSGVSSHNLQPQFSRTKTQPLDIPTDCQLSKSTHKSPTSHSSLTTKNTRPTPSSKKHPDESQTCSKNTQHTPRRSDTVKSKALSVKYPSNWWSPTTDWRAPVKHKNTSQPFRTRSKQQLDEQITNRPPTARFQGHPNGAPTTGKTAQGSRQPFRAYSQQQLDETKSNKPQTAHSQSQPCRCPTTQVTTNASLPSTSTSQDQKNEIPTTSQHRLHTALFPKCTGKHTRQVQELSCLLIKEIRDILELREIYMLSRCYT